MEKDIQVHQVVKLALQVVVQVVVVLVMKMVVHICLDMIQT